ncbi:hypothetical protein BGZ61DRAFT_526463 [Ilyonectria robusta]|uniref:uncharacterized protein n=1 Tax=Ilyonectria robusta TaxID=1079257 RepID=UPI001E8D2DF7|nr:uncharacterized protein BGZ61DRAFT_526463 [Ilyonectria robusta]KAH8735365.1 hypothetical protein BGZ61DRAFT_526463 [Ilyonectria robusta]
MDLLQKFYDCYGEFLRMLLRFNVYDAGIMIVIIADDQFNDTTMWDADRKGIIATAP